MVIYQGNTYKLPIKLSINGKIIAAEDVKKVEFAIGEVVKTYPDQATHNGENFICPLTQEDTFSLKKGKTDFQVRVQFSDESVKCTGTRAVTVCEAISKAVL